MSLRRVTPEVYYCKTSSGLEVDFIAQMGNHSRMLVQVCESMVAPQTRKREVAALDQAMVQLGLKTGTIVMRSEEGQISVGGGVIQVLPIWRFLLELLETQV